MRRILFMAISETQEADILRYYYAEKWRIGTIAQQLRIHHSVVRRVLSQAGVPASKQVRRPSKLDAFLPFVQDTLAKFPRLPASRLYAMACARGYQGGPSHFRHVVSLHRPRPAAEAYLRLRTLPGEQAQVDWGHFGYVMIGKAKRPLMAFVMVLSFSRKIFLRFYLNQQMANFLHGHEAAFNAFGGVPRVLLYDNLRSAVIERQGDAIRFNPTLLSFAAHYRFEVRPVAVARGNEKGRVERAIRYVRDNFFPARQWKDSDDLNQQARDWCEGPAANRPCPEDKAFTVQHTFVQEQATLMALPDNPYPVPERVEVNVGKTPYVRFDLNDYSVPHTHVKRRLTLVATVDKVTLVDGATLLAEHARCYDKAQQIENPAHIQALATAKKQARLHRGQDYLSKAVPLSTSLLTQAADMGYSLRPIILGLVQLLQAYGAAELTAAIAEALHRRSPHPNSVRWCLQKRRAEQKLPPPVPLDLPPDSRITEIIVRAHALTDYDQLSSSTLTTPDGEIA
jgi:transposase